MQELRDGRFCLLRSVIDSGGKEVAQKAFESFYKERGISRLRARVDYYAGRVGVVPGKMQIRDIGYRWASCSKNGNLQFHWRCLMAPLTVIDYIVVHELCHFRRRNHDEQFWNEVDKVLPDYGERKEWLRIRGAALDI